MRKEMRSYPCGGRGPWIAGRIARGIAIGLVFAVVFAVFVQLLWNWLMPGVFGLREISYWQAFGLIVLAHILFGPRGMHGARPGLAGSWHRHGHWGWGGPCTKEDAANGEIADWGRYDEWWNAEGREAFKKYIESQGKSTEGRRGD